MAKVKLPDRPPPIARTEDEILHYVFDKLSSASGFSEAAVEYWVDLQIPEERASFERAIALLEARKPGLIIRPVPPAPEPPEMLEFDEVPYG